MVKLETNSGPLYIPQFRHYFLECFFRKSNFEDLHPIVPFCSGRHRDVSFNEIYLFSNLMIMIKIIFCSYFSYIH